jgi:predicted KAP-like P-loop ATPase
VADIFISDNETKTDLLYYESIAKTVVNLLMTDVEKPLSVGIHGDWGAGKSSILAMIEHEVGKGERTLCLRFNGWLFQGFEDAKTVLLESIVEGILDARPTVAEIKAQAKGLFRRIDWFKVAKKTGGLLATFATGMPIGRGTEAVIEKLKVAVCNPGPIDVNSIKEVLGGAGDLLKDGDEENMARQIHKFREEFGQLIEAAQINRLVILLDDLDRCLPTTAIETLEAAKLFLFLPRVAFVVAADEGMIEYSVKQHFPDMPIGQAGASYARAYLEKLIQVPFRIPALGDVEIHAYIALLMAEAALGADNGHFSTLLDLARQKLTKPWEGGKIEMAEIEKTPALATSAVKQGLTLSDQLATVLARGTQGNPRQVKRFLNSLMLREAIASARGMSQYIKRPVLAKIMIAERFHPDFYVDLCATVNTAKDGKAKQFAIFAKKEGTDEKAKRQKLDSTWEKWAGDEAIQRWFALEPNLNDEDLRPYTFVTRDKKASLGFGIVDALDELADQLMGGRLSIQAAKAKMSALTTSEAAQIFDKLRARILVEDSFANVTTDGPSGFPGMLGLAQDRTELQLRLVQFLEDAPVTKLGAWATNAGRVLTGEALEKWKTLRKNWAEQTENPKFAKAVRTVAGIRKG